MGDRASLRRESGCFGVNRHRVGMCFGLGDSSGIYHVTGRPAPVTPGPAGWHPMSIGVVTAAVCIRVLRMASAQKARGKLRHSACYAPTWGLRNRTTQDYLLGGLSIVGLMWWYSGSAASRLR